MPIETQGIGNWPLQVHVHEQHENKKNHESESVESRGKRLASQSLYQREQIAYESVECRQHRLANQHQYDKEKNASEPVECRQQTGKSTAI